MTVKQDLLEKVQELNDLWKHCVLFQSPTSSPSLFYLHPSEVIYQPVGIAQEGGCVPSPFLLVEAAVPEVFL